MAVVEVGAWCVRAGYVGDAACTRVMRSLYATAAPHVTDWSSMLRSAAAAHDEQPPPHRRGAGDGTSEQTQQQTQQQHDKDDDDDVAAARRTAQPSRLLPLWTTTQAEAVTRTDTTIGDDVASPYTTSFLQHTDEHVASLRYVTRELLACSADDPLLLVVPEWWHAQSQLPLMQRLFECVLEGDGVAPLLYCMRPSVACALSMGCASAVVLDVGHSHCTTAAVLDGYALRGTVETCAVGGAHVTADWMATLARTSGLVRSLRQHYTPRLRNDAALRHCIVDAVSDVKCACGFVRRSRRGAAEAANNNSRSNNGGGGGDDTAVAEATRAEKPRTATVQLPDGATLTLDDAQCSDAFERLFARRIGATKRSRSGDVDDDDEDDNKEDSKDNRDDDDDAFARPSYAHGSVNVADMVVRCKQRLDPEWRVRAVQHVIAGGTAQAHGFAQRLLHELQQRDAAYVRYVRDGAMHVTRSADATWTGASLAAAASSFAALWVSRSEWQEEGARVLCRKLFY